MNASMLANFESRSFIGPMEDEGERIPVALVDDDSDDRLVGQRVVLRSRYFRLVGSYENGEDALKSPAIEQAKVVLMDIRMSGLSGIDSTRLLKKLLPALTILMLTVVDEPAMVKDALLAGADGFLTKPLSETECVEAILYALAGGMPLAKGMMRRAIGFSHPSPARRALSERQNAVLDGIKKGRSNKEIAAEMHVSVEGVKKSVHAILAKTSASSRNEAVVRLDAGML